MRADGELINAWVRYRFPEGHNLTYGEVQAKRQELLAERAAGTIEPSANRLLGELNLLGKGWNPEIGVRL